MSSYGNKLWQIFHFSVTQLQDFENHNSIELKFSINIPCRLGGNMRMYPQASL